MTKELKIAEQIAREAHKEQKRWDWKPYITHPEAVANSLTDIDCKIAAWLHDVIEDTDFNIEHLDSRGIPKGLIPSVVRLTRLPHESYKGYILNIRKDKIATRVKIADLKNNISNLKKGNMKDKYELALYILEEKSKDGNR